MRLVKALLCQLLALAVVLALRLWAPAPITPWPAVILQALLAGLFSRWIGQPLWWLPMHLLFMPAVLLSQTFHLPAGWYLLGLLGLVLVFWGTVKGDVPLFLSSNAVSEALIAIVRREQARSFADIGAGLGTIVAPLATACPDVRILALERAPLPWLFSACRCRRHPNVRAKLASFWDLDLGQFDVVFAFLSPLVMARVGAKIRREMRGGSLFVSSSFPIPEGNPESVLDLADSRKTKLYCYRIAP
ncbi:class I SAM-dependent methyltransferase [Methylomonas montana]|uniref:class I SAM-dependent methyltransferase n=1 Tax=Methylomonas montana TaxID=3058963 RepID=UPI002659E607|nr:class I SAM-dependent methyltransferase [Methylomonas montana]WKJ90107.1 class I SAM-dependent methyltransferase [Methylomonas montana]